MKNFLLFLSLFLLVSGCINNRELPVEKGISCSLAKSRKMSLSNIEYKLNIIVPLDVNKSLSAKELIGFDIKSIDQDLQIDFKEDASKIHKIICNGLPCQYRFELEHIVINKNNLLKGANSILIEFELGSSSLNRNKEYLYSLFVPDRARTAIPCFDQPDLKANFSLTLDVDSTWIAMSNGKLGNKVQRGGRSLYHFSKTEALPTYLFSFVAGKFDVLSRKHNGKTYNLFHREKDKVKLDDNVDEVFKLLFNSLDWLEEYTAIDYPFAKYDMIAIPSFQYGGMEHTGATLYRSSKLFLDKNPTKAQLLARANLIAHETAHMWFGDLVTMKWFDQVWLKEVFANFMADKIVNPHFPQMNHKLKFIMAHYPKAYNVDRTDGANPINQKLKNLNVAGSLYGNIIYHKSPIVMEKLESVIGENELRDGLRKYLKDFSYGNASWEDLISILDTKSSVDLQKWSDVWVNEPGRPTYAVDMSLSDDDKINSLLVRQKSESRLWFQQLKVVLVYKDHFVDFVVDMNASSVVIDDAVGLGKPLSIIINGDGYEYGYFEMDKMSCDYLLSNISTIDDEVLRAVSWINIWENFLNGKIVARDLFNSFVNNIPKEKNTLNIELLLSYLKTFYWLDLTNDERKSLGSSLENMLWRLMNETSDLGLKSSYFNTLVSVAESDEMLSRLYSLWHGELDIKGLYLSEKRLTDLACVLAISLEDKSDEILREQLKRIKDVDGKARLEFIMPSLSSDKMIRDSFFDSINKVKNREHEPWVSQALYYLHHPLRREEAVGYIKPSLYLLKEIQDTGDIFFPKSWLSATYCGHNSKKAARVTKEFLDSNKDYPMDLKLKILQASDRLLRMEN